MKYPEHEKMKKVYVERQAIGEFLEFLQNEGFTIQRNEMVYRDFNGLLAEFFDVDLKKVELEKRAMLTEFRKLHEVGPVSFVEQMMYNEAEASVALDRNEVGTFAVEEMPSHGDKGE